MRTSFSPAAFIRTSPALLEHLTNLLEVLECLLEDPDPLFEHRPLILEVPCFISTFTGLLEHHANLLENRRHPHQKSIPPAKSEMPDALP